MKSKALYILLGIINACILAPFFAWVLTLGITDFEGARGFAGLYLTPVIFIILLVVLFIDYRIFFKPNSNFLKQRSYIFLLVIAITFIGLKISNYNSEKKQKEFAQNKLECVAQVKDYYEGYVIDTVYKSLTVRKMDSNYTEFKYKYFNINEFSSIFYRGQKISKKANETEFDVVLRNGETKTFKIPCYE